ncbi:predicted protein [Naegleria gruberi]|uniref:Predicted protein n=1 Tax=Naegleria gruberi TaxID=5762 RepID=D2VET1_NAEGR|nr:uncharacterized protein NAEGRDRAFT_48949 [Naegleria gruberi]EFC44657.1 predicted protein [Naegleria gruberi]|eukprot:XP_002677401.1 predicted protein [Naegleria gruberi strain NEG-M]
MGLSKSKESTSTTKSTYKVINYADKKYYLIDTLGSGNFGSVYLIRDVNSNEEFALKVIEESETNSSSIIKEVKLAQECEHPNIVKIYDYKLLKTSPITKVEDISKVFLCIRMEVCQGNLNQILERLKKENIKVSAKVAFQWFIKMLHVLKELNELKIIHRGLDKVEVKIGDFGVGTQLQAHQSKAKTIAGDVFYQAPEVFTKSYTPKVDVYSLGIIFVQVLASLPEKDYRTNLAKLAIMVNGKLDINSLINVQSNQWFVKTYQQILARLLTDKASLQVMKLMVCDADSRLEARELLQHPIVTTWDNMIENKNDNDISKCNDSFIALLSAACMKSMKISVRSLNIINSWINEKDYLNSFVSENDGIQMVASQFSSFNKNIERLTSEETEKFSLILQILTKALHSHNSVQLVISSILDSDLRIFCEESKISKANNKSFIGEFLWNLLCKSFKARKLFAQRNFLTQCVLLWREHPSCNKWLEIAALCIPYLPFQVLSSFISSIEIEFTKSAIELAQPHQLEKTFQTCFNYRAEETIYRYRTSNDDNAKKKIELAIRIKELLEDFNQEYPLLISSSYYGTCLGSCSCNFWHYVCKTCNKKICFQCFRNENHVSHDIDIENGNFTCLEMRKHGISIHHYLENVSQQLTDQTLKGNESTSNEKFIQSGSSSKVSISTNGIPLNASLNKFTIGYIELGILERKGNLEFLFMGCTSENVDKDDIRNKTISFCLRTGLMTIECKSDGTKMSKQYLPPVDITDRIGFGVTGGGFCYAIVNSYVLPLIDYSLIVEENNSRVFWAMKTEGSCVIELSNIVPHLKLQNRVRRIFAYLYECDLGAVVSISLNIRNISDLIELLKIKLNDRSLEFIRLKENLCAIHSLEDLKDNDEIALLNQQQELSLACKTLDLNNYSLFSE